MSIDSLRHQGQILINYVHEATGVEVANYGDELKKIGETLNGMNQAVCTHDWDNPAMLPGEWLYNNVTRQIIDLSAQAAETHSALADLNRKVAEAFAQTPKWVRLECKGIAQSLTEANALMQKINKDIFLTFNANLEDLIGQEDLTTTTTTTTTPELICAQTAEEYLKEMEAEQQKQMEITKAAYNMLNEAVKILSTTDQNNEALAEIEFQVGLFNSLAQISGSEERPNLQELISGSLYVIHHDECPEKIVEGDLNYGTRAFYRQDDVNTATNEERSRAILRALVLLSIGTMQHGINSNYNAAINLALEQLGQVALTHPNDRPEQMADDLTNPAFYLHGKLWEKSVEIREKSPEYSIDQGAPEFSNFGMQGWTDNRVAKGVKRAALDSFEKLTRTWHPK